MRAIGRVLAAAAAMAATAGCTAAGQGPAAVRWPHVVSRVHRSAADEARLSAIIARMSLEEKVAQIVQPDISAVTPADMRRYRFGSILAGGNSAPGGVETAPAAEWLKLADAFWDASMEGSEGAARVPMMFGIDAVHGHANIVGATIFPHNIGLGAARDPELIRRIGEVTAREMAVTGFDWDFSPTLAVVRDDRWGRTYEGFAEDPEVVRAYAGKMVEGLQGRPGTPEFLRAGKVIATAKHFVGDGGTAGGKDQGDNPSTPQQLRDIHGAGYPPAIEAGVQAVMASFSSVRGEKVHGSRALLTGALKQDMGFDGLVVGDWNAHGQVPGCTNTSCPTSINAGLDMFMAPDSWKGLYESTLAQARSGEIPVARLDDAVRRILRVKLRAGLFDKGRPSSRPLAGRFELLGAPEHRAVARQAVRESLVLLKNRGQLLPLSPKLDVLVAGDGADNIAKQAGGWTITWQGTGLEARDFPHAQSIWSGISETVAAAGGRATLSPDGSFVRKPDVAIVVFGEDPYAEFVGDRPRSLEFSPADKKDLDLLRRLQAAGVPVVAIFLSGRPMWVNPEINASDAFVAAFLPGSEGGGIADVLFRQPGGAIRYDFRGRLSYSWPRRADQTPLNRGDRDYDPLFAYGFGLSYADAGDLPALAEARPAGAGMAEGVFFARGALPQGWRWAFEGEPGAVMRGVDRRAQEDARSFAWPGGGEATASIAAVPPVDISREATGELSLVAEYRVDAAPDDAVMLWMACGDHCGGEVPIAGLLRAAPVGEWRTLTVPLRCFVRAGLDPKAVRTPFAITTSGRLRLSLSDVRIASAAVPQDRCGG
ncbi:MAG: exo 1,3/1,4-beta-D-glucan glucohydrolase [Alphaproteobacteria bacterium]|nr:exo 1,3/1,4-beta-D-glucan glucohydrolase [Alphaproteobacteria bacterium]MBV9370093.1 exo 1,3/1,4-beta-D-glucan glucohydrolase [Alphaproteobacteria bacterium]MBV9901007.1 exo 1,3/1,4-beta-D-glucan glucohydrolase [Alphaproteobacteria bacterium]